MKSGKPPVPPGGNDEINALIEVLHNTGQRLEALTAGEVDAVANREGRTFMLRRAQDQLRHDEAVRQAAILNAIPAHIIMLDPLGNVVSVNEGWLTDFAANGLLGPHYAVGINYLDVCDHAEGADQRISQSAAQGIRAVLSGESTTFSMEYSWVSASEAHWFLLTVTPIASELAGGAVVMHTNITERKRAAIAFEKLSQETQLRERILSTTLASMTDFAYIYDRQGRILFANLPLLDFWEMSLEDVVGRSFLELSAPNDLARLLHGKIQKVFATGKRATDETSHVGAGGLAGHYEHILSPVRAADGGIEFVVGSTRDITERIRSAADLVISARTQKLLAEQLAAERTRLVEAQELAKIGSWEMDLSSSEVIWSDQTHRIYETGTAALSPTHDTFYDLVHPDDRIEVREAFSRSFVQRTACQIQHRTLLPSGKIKFLEQRWRVSFDVVGKATRAVGTCQDISERMVAENRIAYLNRVYAMLSGVNALIVRVKDRDELFREACRIAVDEGGFRMAFIGILDPLGTGVVPVASAGKDGALVAHVRSVLASSEGAKNSMIARAMLEKKTLVFNDLQNDPDGFFGPEFDRSGVRSAAKLPLIVSGNAIGVLVLYAGEIDFFHAEEFKLINELAGDIGYAIDHIEKQERLDYFAFYDELTGLANRSLFLERVTQYMQSAAAGAYKLAVTLIDLERFKNINDTLGQPAGDTLLKQVAEWLLRRAGNASLVTRIGADHFAIVLPKVREGGNLGHMLEKAMAAFLQHPIRVDDSLLRIGAKAGIAVFPDDGTDADSLLKHAEAALKNAKATGDRILFYTQKMTEKVADRLTLENQLRQAIDKGEFVLHYQPKISLMNDKLTGAEALIRWNHPRRGLVAPGFFIPLLEETGLIHEVGRWALCQAVKDYLGWRKTGLTSFRVGVNVSPLQLRDKNFISEIEQTIGVAENVGAGLELEITESLIMADVHHSIASLQAIRNLGVIVAIDDFGTGFSSLSYLAKLPVDTLKIDRSFVTAMTAGPEGLALVSTIINLAHSLKLIVVAEGVETEEQRRLLRLLGCDEMQGFLISKAVPLADFESTWLKQRQNTDRPTIPDRAGGATVI